MAAGTPCSLFMFKGGFMDALIQYKGSNPYRAISVTELSVFMKNNLKAQTLEWKSSEITKKGNSVSIEAKNISINGNTDLTAAGIREDILYADFKDSSENPMKSDEVMFVTFIEDKNESHTIMCYGGAIW